MQLTAWAVRYGVAALVFFLLDGVWLGVVARGFYRRELGPLLRDDVVWPAAIAFYLLYIAGLVFFAVVPAGTNPMRAALLGGLLGLFAYQTYDFTNLATLKGFSWSVALADIAWGGVASAIAAGTAAWAAQRWS